MFVTADAVAATCRGYAGTTNTFATAVCVVVCLKTHVNGALWKARIYLPLAS